MGETIAGIGLTLGLFTGVASLVGLILVVNYGLATQWMSPGQQGFHIVLLTLMIAFFFARAGRTWGLDALARWTARPEVPVRAPAVLLSALTAPRWAVASHAAHHAVGLAVGVARAVDHAEHAVRLPALVPLAHDAPVLGREPLGRQISV